MLYIMEQKVWQHDPFYFIRNATRPKLHDGTHGRGWAKWSNGRHDREAWKAQFGAKTNVDKEYKRRWWRESERKRGHWVWWCLCFWKQIMCFHEEWKFLLTTYHILPCFPIPSPYLAFFVLHFPSFISYRCDFIFLISKIWQTLTKKGKKIQIYIRFFSPNFFVKK